MISGTTRLIAHLGYPTESFKAPLIYNPYFEEQDIDAVVVPMGCKPEDYPDFLQLIFRLSNIHGALITMPHKITTMGLLDEISTNARVAGSCNAVKLDSYGRLIGDMFDGEGFVRGLKRKGQTISGAKALMIGAGGVGSAIAASLAAAGLAHLALYDDNNAALAGLKARLNSYYPSTEVATGSNDPVGFDIVINATPLGMNQNDPLPVDINRLSPETFVGEVVMKEEITPFLAAARERGCRYQVGTDMLFEQIPAYLEFFGFPTTTAEHLRKVARI
ncbi:shikimate dehydrogenase family protein [Rhizobium mesoamericanum]|uniref:Shikimate dehydrogenase substrate binding domain protein n=1 Tax=Rhizobium mesoamericanum STM3625 TaxID=1211777 RepID=K0PK72_9HYPH|nr:ThiF family adenylyltransferase [Rhizobium mesoamericanum]CCM76891.1 Shikimate dehydrogenase substrate binding domain protein [Rhizobium mesoamericanum STM3625]